MLRALRRAALTTAAATFATFAVAGGAVADSAGPDPGSNYPAPPMPPACSAPTSTACIAATVDVLDHARGNLGQPPYSLPSTFVSLTPVEQGFVLANLDRVLYGLAPIPGLTAALSADAMSGVHRDADPQPSASNYLAWTANWAGGFTNMPLAYEAWMYDDGPGSGNLDCTASHATGCWGHRHDVLYRFDTAGPLAMGAAQGTDSGGETGYAMLLFEGDNTYAPVYTYTWAQAVAAGANSGKPGSVLGTGGTGSGGGSHSPGRGAVSSSHGRVRLTALRVRGRHVTVTISAPRGSKLQCAFTPRGKHGWARDHFRACRAALVLAGHHGGRYRLRVRAAGVILTRYISIR
jgi:hypothetical protein